MYIGTDIIEIQRIARALSRQPAFAGRILTPLELESWQSRKMPVSFVAGRFAAKEAVVKCLGLGLRGFSWQDMEILSTEAGAPELKLSPHLREIAQGLGIGKIQISISHSRDYALAVAIGEDSKNEDCNG